MALSGRSSTNGLSSQEALNLTTFGGGLFVALSLPVTGSNDDPIFTINPGRSSQHYQQ